MTPSISPSRRIGTRILSIQRAFSLKGIFLVFFTGAQVRRTSFKLSTRCSFVPGGKTVRMVFPTRSVLFTSHNFAP